MKKSKLQKVMHTVVAALLSLITIFSTTVGAFAWTVDGSGVASGGGGKATNKGYSIPSEFTKSPMRIAGARFSVYNKYSGETLGTIDVFRNTPSGANYITAEKFSVKLNKIQLKKVYNKQSFNTTTSQANCYQASAVASDLPMYAQGMKDWEANPDNFSKVLLKAVGISNVSNLSPGDMILIEPLFPLKAHGTTFVLTPTEIAILGAQEFDGWDSTGPSTSQEGTWGYISHYTNVFYPQAMFLDTTSLPEELPVGWVLHSGGGKATNAEHASFRTIIEKGFGVHIAYENTRPQWEPPTLETSFEKYNFNVVAKLYNEAGTLIATITTPQNLLATNPLTFTNTTTTIEYTDANGNRVTKTAYIPVPYTFTTATEMTRLGFGDTLTGIFEYNSGKYLFDSATLSESSGNNQGNRTTNITNRATLYSVQGDSTLTLNFYKISDKIKVSYTSESLPTGDSIQTSSTKIRGLRYFRTGTGEENFTYWQLTYDLSELSTTETLRVGSLLGVEGKRIYVPNTLHGVWGYNHQTKQVEYGDWKFANIRAYYYSTPDHPNGLEKGGAFNLLNYATNVSTYDEALDEHYMDIAVADNVSYEVLVQYEKIPDEYTINFDANGGTGSMESITTTAKEPVQLSKNTFTHDGYDFTGWYLRDDDKMNTLSSYKWYGYNSAMIPGWYTENEMLKDSNGNPWKILIEDEAWLNSTTATITKLTELDDGNTAPSVGSTIVVYDSAGKEVAREVTNDAGRITINGLDKGKYTYCEVKRSDGKEPDATVYTFTVDADGSVSGDDNVIGEKIVVDKRYGSITCYAQWQAQEIYIEYNGNGGVGEMERQTVRVTPGAQGAESDYSISPNEFYYAGRQFLYWSATYTDTDTGITYALGRKRDSSAAHGWATGWYELGCYDDPQQYQEIELQDGEKLWQDQLPASLALQTIVLTAHWQKDFDIQYYEADSDAVLHGDYATVGKPLLLGSNFVGASTTEKHYFGAVIGANSATNAELASVFREQVNYNGTSWILSDGTKMSNSQTPESYISPAVQTQADVDQFVTKNNIGIYKKALTVKIENLSDFDERGNNTKQMFENCLVHIYGTPSGNKNATLDMYFKVSTENMNKGAVLKLKNFPYAYGSYTFEIVSPDGGTVFWSNGPVTSAFNLLSTNTVNLSVCFNTDFYGVVTDKNDANYGKTRYALDNFVLPSGFDGTTAISYPVVNRSSLNQASTSTYNASQFSSAAAADGTFNLLLQPKLDFFPDDVSLTGNKAGYKFHIFNVEGNEKIDFYVTTDANGEVKVAGLPRNRTYYIESCDNPVYLQCATSTVYLGKNTSSSAANKVATVRYDFRLNGAYEYIVNEGVGMFQLTGDSYFSSYDIMGNQTTIPSWLSDAEELNTNFPTAGVGNTRHTDFDLQAVIGSTMLNAGGFANSPLLVNNFCTFHYNRENGISLPDSANLSTFTRLDDADGEEGVYVSKSKGLSSSYSRLSGYKGYYYIIDEVNDTIKVVFLTAEDMITPVTVLYDKNNVQATGEMGTQLARKNQTITLLENQFALENYDFVGWYAKDDKTGEWCVALGSGTSWLDESSITVLDLQKKLFTDMDSFTIPSNKEGGSITMYAQWKPKPYYVSYDGNGGTLKAENADTQINNIEVSFEEQYTVLDNLYEKEKSDFAFWALKKTEGAVNYYLGYNQNNVLGWYKSPSILYQVQPNDKILEQIIINDGTTDFTLGPVGSHFVLEAQWNTHFTVNFLDSSGNPAFTSWNSYAFVQGAYTNNGASNNAYEGSNTASAEYLRDYSHYTWYYGKTQPRATIRLATTKNGTYNGYVNVIPIAYNNNTGISATPSRVCRKCWPSYPAVNYDAKTGNYVCSKCGSVVPPEYNSVNKLYRSMQAFDGVNSWYAYKAVIKSPTEIDIILYTKPEVVPNYQIHYNKNDDLATGSMSSNLIYVETDDFITTPTLNKNQFQKNNFFYKYWYLHDDDENQWYGYYNGVLGWYPSSVAFSGYKVAYDGAPFVNVNKANATIQYKGANVTLSVSPDFQFYAVSDEETLTLSKLNGSVTVFAQWQQIPKKFTVEFVDKNGNPAFDAWNSAVRYEYNSTSGLEIATGASETHFADSLIDFGNDKFNGYILLAGTPDGTLSLATTGIDKLYFDYSYLTGVSPASNQKYNTVLPLTGNTKWNYYKMIVDEENDKIVVTLYERYNVHYVANGGAGTMPTDSVDLGTQYTVRENAFTNEHAEFAGYWYARKTINGKQYWYGYNSSNQLGWMTAPTSYYKFTVGSKFGKSTYHGEIASVGENVYMVAQWNTPITVRFVDENGNPAFPDNVNSGIQYWRENASWGRTQSQNAEQSYFDTYDMDEKTRGITLFLAKNTSVNYLTGVNYRDQFFFLYNRNSGVYKYDAKQEYDTRLKLTNSELWNYYSISIPNQYEVVVTLYDVHYNINYNANGGVGTMASQKAWPNVDKQLTANQFTKNMSTFDCWYMKDDDTGLWYGYSTAGDESTLGWYKTPAEYFRVEDESTINLPKEDGSVTLYAQWLTGFVVRFVDKDGNPAFADNISSGIRYLKADGAWNVVTTNKAEKSYFDVYDMDNKTRGLALLLGKNSGIDCSSNAKNRDEFAFYYNRNIGVIKNSTQQYDMLCKLKNNEIWNYYKISIPNPNEVVVTLYDLNYKIDYIGNGATSGAMSASTGYEDKDITLSTNAYNRDQFAFRGWYLYDTDENAWYGTKGGVTGWYPSSEVLPGYSDAYAAAEITKVTEQKVTYLGTFGATVERSLAFSSDFTPYRAKDGETFNFAKVEGIINAYALWAAEFTVSYVNPDGTPAFDNWNNHVTYYKGTSSLWTPLGHDAQTTYYSSSAYALDDFVTGVTRTNYAILLNKQTDGSTANGYHLFPFNYNSDSGVSKTSGKTYDTMVYFNAGGASPFENHQWDAYSVSVPDAHNVVITLYDLSYTINYDANGGNGEMASQKGHPNADVQLQNNAFTKENFGFRYWHLKDDDSGLWYGYNAENVLGWYAESDIVSYKAIKDGSVLNLPKEKGSVTLFAQWAANFTIEFQNPDGTPAFDSWKTLSSYATTTTKVVLTGVSTAPTVTYYAPEIIQNENFKDDGLAAVRIGIYRYVNISAHPEIRYIPGLGYTAENGLKVTNKNLFDAIRPFGAAVTFEGHNWNAYKLTLVDAHKAIVTLYDLNYKIQFDANGGSGYMDPQYGRYGIDVKLNPNAFTRAGYDYTGWRLQDNDNGRWYGYNASGVIGWYAKAVCENYGYVELADEQTINLRKLQGTVTAYAQWVQNPVEFRVHFLDENGNEAFDSWNSAVRYEKTTTSGLVQSNKATTEYYPSSVGELSYNTYEAYVSLANHASDNIDLTNASSMIQVKFNYNFATGISESLNQTYNEMVKFKDNEKWMSYKVWLNEETDDIYIMLFNWPPRELQVEYYQPNADYVVQTSIIATFKVTNDTMYAYNPDDGNVTMYMKMYSGIYSSELGNTSGKLIADMRKDFVIPPDKSQNVYFKIPIPNNSKCDNITFEIKLVYNGQVIGTYTTITNYDGEYKDTLNPNGYTTRIIGQTYEQMAKYGYSTVIPRGYQNQDAKDVPRKKVPNVGTWDEYIYNDDGTYEKVTYYSYLRVDKGMTEPNYWCPVWWKDEERNAAEGKDRFYNLMRSGYGIDVYYASAFYKSDSVAQLTGGVACTDTNAFVPAQLSKIYYPENNYGAIPLDLKFFDQSVNTPNASYSAAFDTASASFYVSRGTDGWIDKKDITQEQFNNATRSCFYRLNHFTPMWAKDGDYAVQPVVTNAWTPAGMLSASNVFDTTRIEGSIYSDWRWVSGKVD